MKELTIEQKAEAYDLALDRAKKWRNAPNIDKIPTFGNRVIEEIFPELKESEDEKIRGKLIHLVKKSHEQGGYALHKWDADEMLAWLERQKVLTTEEDLQGKEDVLWCIKQAKKYAKDENEMGTCWFAEKWLEKQNSNVDNANKEYWRGYREGKQEILDKYAELETQGKKEINDEVKPKFCEKDWIVDKSGLVQQVLDFRGGMYTCTYNSFTTDCESDYHLWTIQDAKDGDVLCYKDEISLYKHDIKNCTKQGTTFGGFVYHCCYDGKRFIVDSFYSLTEQDKMDIQPATKEQCDTLMKAMADAGYTFDFEKKELKKISQRMISAEAKEAMYGKPTAWSEEDENEVAILEAYIRSGEWSESHIDRALGIVDELVNKVKSLKPQKHWKPNDTELEVLRLVAEKDGTCLMGLYEQLKKLREE